MRKYLYLFFLFSFLFSQEDDLYQNNLVEDVVSDLRQTLLEKGVKFFTVDSSSTDSKVSTSELIIDLRNPHFSNGILMTREGGVIKNSDIRIQAKNIQYIKRMEKGQLVHKIEAEGDLMMIYKDRVFIGEELEYDFIEKNGQIYNGKTYASPWYLGGDKISLSSNGSYKIENVVITTCENADSSWDIHASSVSVEKKDLLKAKKLRFRLFKFPALWLPSFKINLKKFFSKPIIKYKVNWDKASGPRGSIRYQAYSWRDLALFLRLDYRLKMGFGGAIESEYFPSHKNTSFVTRSYLAEDMVPKELKKKRRYRLQGSYKHTSPDEKTYALLTWDKYSDIRMPQDFKSDDFEIQTAKKTEFLWRKENNSLITLVHARARANNFETIKQDIPTIYAHFHPLKSEKTGFFFSNWLKLSYLDYAYSHDISELTNIHSFRAETHNEIYRPLNLNGFTFIPKAGFIGIAYSDSPSSDPRTLATFLYEAKIKTDFYRNFQRHQHLITPYLEYQGLSTPNVSFDNHYIFSIADGYNRLNLLKIGVLNQLFSLKQRKTKPSFEAEIYANCFFDASHTHLITPKGYLNLNWNLPSVFLLNQNAWNFYKKTLDFTKLRLGWTVNENVALSLEFRYRSQYDWRKADHDNFILNVSREEKELLTSPISDKRCSFLSHIFIRINPYWTCHIESHHGWNRANEPSYNEFKIDLFTMLSTNWKIKLSYMHTEKDDRFTFDYYLLKL